MFNQNLYVMSKVKITAISDSKNPDYKILRVQMDEEDLSDSENFFDRLSVAKSANYPIKMEIAERFSVGQVLQGAKIITKQYDEPQFEEHEAFTDGLYYLNQVVPA